jgi:chromosome segregation ATPase
VAFLHTLLQHQQAAANDTRIAATADLSKRRPSLHPNPKKGARSAQLRFTFAQALSAAAPWVSMARAPAAPSDLHGLAAAQAAFERKCTKPHVLQLLKCWLRSDAARRVVQLQIGVEHASYAKACAIIEAVGASRARSAPPCAKDGKKLQYHVQLVQYLSDLKEKHFMAISGLAVDDEIAVKLWLQDRGRVLAIMVKDKATAQLQDQHGLSAITKQPAASSPHASMFRVAPAATEQPTSAAGAAAATTTASHAAAAGNSTGRAAQAPTAVPASCASIIDTTQKAARLGRRLVKALHVAAGEHSGDSGLLTGAADSQATVRALQHQRDSLLAQLQKAQTAGAAQQQSVASLQASLQQRTADVDALQAELVPAQAAVSSAQSTAVQAATTLSSSETAVTGLLGKLSEGSHQLSAKQGEVAALTTKLADSEADRTVAVTRLLAATTSLRDLETAASTTASKLAAVEQELRTAQQKLFTATAALTVAETQLASKSAQLNNIAQQLLTEQSQRSTAEQQLATAESELTETNKHLTAAQTQLQEATAKAEAATAEAVSLRLEVSQGCLNLGNKETQLCTAQQKLDSAVKQVLSMQKNAAQLQQQREEAIAAAETARCELAQVRVTPETVQQESQRAELEQQLASAKQELKESTKKLSASSSKLTSSSEKVALLEARLASTTDALQKAAADKPGCCCKAG